MNALTRKKRRLIRRRTALQRTRSWLNRYACPCGGQDAVHWATETDLRRWGLW